MEPPTRCSIPLNLLSSSSLRSSFEEEECARFLLNAKLFARKSLADSRTECALAVGSLILGGRRLEVECTEAVGLVVEAL